MNRFYLFLGAVGVLMLLFLIKYLIAEIRHYNQKKVCKVLNDVVYNVNHGIDIQAYSDFFDEYKSVYQLDYLKDNEKR